MSKNTSPTSRSPRRTHATPAAARVASRVSSRSKDKQAAVPRTLSARIRRMFFAVALPDALVVGVIIAVGLALVLLTGSPAAWLPTAIAEGWMVSTLGSASADGISIGVVPALPACLLFVMLATRVHSLVKKRVSVKDLLILLGCIIAVPTLLTLIAWFMLWDAGKVYDVAPPSLLTALPRVWILHLAAMAVGMGPRLWRALARRYGVPRVVVDAASTAGRVLIGFATVAALVFLVLFIVRFDAQAAMLAGYPKLPGVGLAGLIALSIFYIPNAIVATGAVLLGSEFHLGTASVSLFDTVLLPLPPLPILAAVPAQSASWAVGLLALPALVAVVLFLRARPSFAHAALAGVWTALGVVLACYFTSGTLGYYGHVGPMLWLAAGLAFLWTAVPGLLVAAGYYFFDRRAAGAAVAETDEEESHAESVIDESEAESDAVELEARSEDSADDAEADEAEPAETVDEVAEDTDARDEVADSEDNETFDDEVDTDAELHADAEAESDSGAEPEFGDDAETRSDGEVEAEAEDQRGTSGSETAEVTGKNDDAKDNEPEAEAVEDEVLEGELLDVESSDEVLEGEIIEGEIVTDGVTAEDGDADTQR
ncbi:DUF6350 family protein [Corynebacterium sp. DNF00584]|uniref:cell division protein PerM n=1 Tax=Corynebacterium sp. DNF00584 TaxID=1384076 RepID=UPI00079B1D7B|nr:DUF6350 family protein [Corynebacterium sp. DNF00584]KXB55412.1 hypothetical protein HMPREF0307_00876 [Corynebacterium sp. DNF00584]